MDVAKGVSLHWTFRLQPIVDKPIEGNALLILCVLIEATASLSKNIVHVLEQVSKRQVVHPRLLSELSWVSPRVKSRDRLRSMLRARQHLDDRRQASLAGSLFGSSADGLLVHWKISKAPDSHPGFPMER